MQSHLPAWYQITDNPWVLQCVQGYHLEFGGVLPPDNWPLNSPNLTTEQSHTLDQEIQGLLQKKCHRKGSGHKGFLQSDVHCAQKRQRLEANYQLETPQFLPGSPPLQNGGYQQSERRTAEGRLHGKDRPGRSLPNGADLSATSQLPEISLEGRELSLQVLPFRSGNCPKSLYQAATTPCGKDEKEGHTHHCLPGRHFDHGTDRGDADITHAYTSSGVANSQEMCVETSADNRISGFPNQFSDHDNSPTRRQGSESDERMQTHDQQEVSNSARFGPPNRLTIINDTSHQRGPTPLPSSAAVTAQNTLHLTRRVRPADTHQPRSQSRPLMVGAIPARIQWSSSCPSFSKHGADNRRLEVRLGATDQSRSTGGVWTKEERKAHINFLEMKQSYWLCKPLPQ